MFETTNQLVLNGGQIELCFDNLDTSIYLPFENMVDMDD